MQLLYRAFTAPELCCNFTNRLLFRKPQPHHPPLIVRELIDLANYPGASLALLELSLLRLPRVRSCREFERGLIDVRDVVFFLSCAVLALALAFRALESRKWT